MENLSSIEEGKEREGQREDERKEGGHWPKEKQREETFCWSLIFSCSLYHKLLEETVFLLQNIIAPVGEGKTVILKNISLIVTF